MKTLEGLSNLVKNKITGVELNPTKAENLIFDEETLNNDFYPIQKVWLTLNHVCNLKCKWCYDASNLKKHNDDMPFELAKKLVDFAKSVGAISIILMGGEPTLYPYFFDLIKYIKDKGLKVYAITNGHVFKNKSFLNTTIDSGIDYFSVCIKAANKLQQIKVTGTDTFDSLLKVFENLKEVKNSNYNFTTIVSKLTIDNLKEFAKLVATHAPNRLLSYRFCSPCITSSSVETDYVLPRYEMVPKVANQFEEIINILGNNVEFRQSYPFCFWPKKFINKLKEDDVFSSGCLIRSKKRNGITFDSEGNMILCNWFHAYPMAKFGTDFTNKDEFKKIWNSLEIKNIYKEIQAPSDPKCTTCKDYLECKGGCFVRWLSPNGMKI